MHPGVNMVKGLLILSHTDNERMKEVFFVFILFFVIFNVEDSFHSQPAPAGRLAAAAT